MKTVENTKYGRLYTTLVSNAQRRPTQKGYFESHHITPKSLGGDNSPTNLVELTAREHFLAHALLFKHYSIAGTKEEAFKMALPIQLMKNGKAGALSSFSIGAGSSKVYEDAKKVISESMKGSGNPMYGKPSPNKGKTHAEMYSEATLAKISANNILKRKYTEEYTWLNIDTGETVTIPLQEFAILKGLDYRKLIEIVREDLGRRLHKSWTLEGLDYRNKYIRNTCNVTHTFYNLLTSESYDLTIDELMAEHSNLKYKGILDMIRNNNNAKNSSYYNWTLQHTFNNRRQKWQ